MVGNDKSTINKTINLREFLATGHSVGKVNEAFEQKNISEIHQDSKILEHLS